MDVDYSYNDRLVSELIGHRLREDCSPRVYRGSPVLEFWGEEVGFPESDIHSTQAYRIYLEYDAGRVITDAWVQIDGEILSPCSGYSQEVLDRFDYAPVLAWCRERLEA